MITASLIIEKSIEKKGYDKEAVESNNGDGDGDNEEKVCVRTRRTRKRRRSGRRRRTPRRRSGWKKVEDNGEELKTEQIYPILRTHTDTLGEDHFVLD